jgi:hypothetical protein
MAEKEMQGQRTTILRLSKRKNRSARMLHTENLNLEKNLQRNIFP